MPTNPAVIELSALDGSNGFQINGEATGDYSGISVASAGDVNGDGFADLIIGARLAEPNGDTSGATYLVFGKQSGFASNTELSALDGLNGFRLDGVETHDMSGKSVASAGDVNGDGFADLIVGAYRANPNGNNSGASYVLFGRAGGFASNLDLSTLDGTNGFQINGEQISDYSGFSVAGAGVTSPIFGRSAAADLREGDRLRHISSMLRGTISTIARGCICAGDGQARDALEAVRAVNILHVSRPGAFIAALHELAAAFERRLEQADV
jgi:hypothetical protein